jgi:very-short-patch-repair endonuclease
VVDRNEHKSQTKGSVSRKLRRDQTDAERALWAKIRSKQLSGAKFRRQQTIGPYIVDFINFESRLVIEIDGGQHGQDKMRNKDEERTKRLQQRGYQVIRFWDNEVLQNIDGVLEKILEALK